MKRRLALLLAVMAGALAVIALAIASPAVKRSVVHANLTAGKEVPKPKGTKFGAGGIFRARAVVNGSKVTLTVRLRFRRLTGKATAAHIHKGKPGKAGPVIVPLCGPCKASTQKTIKITKAVLTTIKSGKAYVNVHTAKNPAGEIRGQISLGR
jgi:CHRD domain